MRKIVTLLILTFSLIGIGYAYNFDTALPDNISFRVTVKVLDQSMQYKYHKKGNKLKITHENVSSYIDMDKEEITTYIHSTNMAITQKLTGESDTLKGLTEQNTEKINSYKNSFQKVGTKKINGYSCTMYKSTQLDSEACINEPLNIVIYAKANDTTITISDIEKTELPDSEFKVPSNTKIQNFNFNNMVFPQF